jgi:hypothetical protein
VRKRFLRGAVVQVFEVRLTQIGSWLLVRLNADTAVDGRPETLLATQILLGCLNTHRPMTTTSFGPLKSSLSMLRCIGSHAAALHQKHGEVGGERLSGKLPHH